MFLFRAWQENINSPGNKWGKNFWFTNMAYKHTDELFYSSVMDLSLKGLALQNKMNHEIKWSTFFFNRVIVSTWKENSNKVVFSLQVNFEKWSHGEPNNYDGNEKCGVFTGYLNMNWNDLFCEHMLDFVCQIKKGKITFSL